MTNIDRSPRVFQERVVGVLEAFHPGTLGGRYANTGPPPYTSEQAAGAAGDVGAAVPATAGVTFAYDTYTLAANGAQTKTLTQVPIEESLHVYLNGVEQLRTTDWTLSGTTLSLLTAMGALTSDVLDVRYAYSEDIPDDAEIG